MARKTRSSGASSRWELSEMRAALARRDREGLSWAGLSDATGIPVSTLQWWKRKLAAEHDHEDRGFVELVVHDDEATVQDDRFEIVLSSGWLIRVPQRFESESLASLLVVLDTNGC